MQLPCKQEKEIEGTEEEREGAKDVDVVLVVPNHPPSVDLPLTCILDLVSSLFALPACLPLCVREDHAGTFHRQTTQAVRQAGRQAKEARGREGRRQREVTQPPVS
mmetsp:Transcript_37742/g.74212  ORF Transcript_37742/g.74212 Transcript_37742/m.74212 type:complete len:106 (-) Transcript_37742:109-426(-)